MPPSCLSTPTTPRSPPALPEPPRRVWRSTRAPRHHSPPPLALQPPPSTSSTKTETPPTPWIEEDVATDVPEQRHLVQKTRNRRLHRTPTPIEDDEHPRRRQPPRDLAGPARRRRRIRRPHRVSDPATTSVRTRVSISSSSPIRSSPFALCHDLPWEQRKLAAMVDAPHAPVPHSLNQSTLLAPNHTRNVTRHSQLDLVPVCPLPVEALATAAVDLDVDDDSDHPETPSLCSSMRKTTTSKMVATNLPPVLVCATPATTVAR